MDLAAAFGSVSPGGERAPCLSTPRTSVMGGIPGARQVLLRGLVTQVPRPGPGGGAQLALVAVCEPCYRSSVQGGGGPSVDRLHQRTVDGVTRLTVSTYGVDVVRGARTKVDGGQSVDRLHLWG